MEYYPIPCDRGGFVANPNIDMIPPYMMIGNTKNLNLEDGGRQPRGGTSKVTGTSRGSSRGMGIIQYELTGGTDFIVSGSAAGSIYKNDTDTIHTGWTANKHICFKIFEELLFACNGADRPRYWDGAAASMTQMTTLHADWGTVPNPTNYPSKFIVHGRGVSKRLWACGCPDTPFTVYASANGNGNDFSTGGGGRAIDIETEDPYGIVDLAVYGDRIFAIGRHRVFPIDDSSTAVADWGYEEPIWTAGGCKNLVVKTPNDVVMMTETGDIYSLQAAFQTGDYKYASLTNPLNVPINERPYIQKWIQENIDLTKLDNFHAIDDPIHRCIYFFMTPNGYTTDKTALVYFYDRPPNEAWMIHNNFSYASGYDASASCVVETAIGTYQVYTIDYSGVIWKLQTTNLNDNNNPYYHGWERPYTGCGNVVRNKLFLGEKIVTQPAGTHNLNITPYVDNTQLSTTTISLDGGGATLDNFILNTNALGGDQLIDDTALTGSVGKRSKSEIYNSNINEDFFVSQQIIEFEWCGESPP